MPTEIPDAIARQSDAMLNGQAFMMGRCETHAANIDAARDRHPSNPAKELGRHVHLDTMAAVEELLGGDGA